MDTRSGGANLLNWFLPPSEKGSTLNGKTLLPRKCNKASLSYLLLKTKTHRISYSFYAWGSRVVVKPVVLAAGGRYMFGFILFLNYHLRFLPPYFLRY